jgi:hypothetical protein
MISQASKSYSLADIANGVYDAQLTTWAQNVKAWGKPFFYRWNWEMNGTWFNWGSQAASSPTNYVNAWRHFHDIVQAQGATNVTWVWCPNTVYSGSTSLSSLYPGDNYVDWTCIDGYNKSSSTTDWKSFSQLFQQTYNDILTIAPSKPIMIAETSSLETGGSKASWITDALTIQLPNNFPKIQAFVWFNQRFSDSGTWRDYQIESSSSAQTAFANGIASSYYASNTFGSLTPLTKVQPISTSAGTVSRTGDINADNVVNIFDLSILLSNYGKTKAQATTPACDLNNDSQINIFDLSILLSNYGK